MILSDAVRSIWYSLSASVWLGATTMQSPVWTPIGSMFSMLQMVMQLSAPSRITSYSISFQPSEVALEQHLVDRARPPARRARRARARPRCARCRRPCRRACTPAGRPAAGRSRLATARASSIVVTISLSGTGSPISSSSLRKSSRSSALRIVSIGVPERANAVAFEHARVRQRHRQVQAGLPAQRRQQPVRPLALDDALQTTSTVSGSM